MTPRQFLIRIVLVVLIGVADSVLGGISAAWWSAIPLGIAVALAFTAISERILRGKFFGKIGSGLIAAFAVHLTLETATLVALLTLLSFTFGIHVGNHLVFGGAAAAVWLVLCHEALGKVFSLTMLYIATRR